MPTLIVTIRKFLITEVSYKGLWFSHWEIYFYLFMYLFVFFTVDNEHIHKGFLKVCVYLGDHEGSCISWTSINNWFLKYSLTQTNRICKAFHFTWHCNLIKLTVSFQSFFICTDHCFNGFRTEIGIW